MGSLHNAKLPRQLLQVKGLAMSIRPTEGTCTDTGEWVTLKFETFPLRPYQMTVTCPACNEHWTETGSVEEVAALTKR